jgi:hypothetical protein
MTDLLLILMLNRVSTSIRVGGEAFKTKIGCREEEYGTECKDCGCGCMSGKAEVLIMFD